MSEVVKLADAAPDVERDQRNMRRSAARIWRRIRFGVEIAGWIVVAGLILSIWPMP